VNNPTPAAKKFARARPICFNAPPSIIATPHASSWCNGIAERAAKSIGGSMPAKSDALYARYSSHQQDDSTSIEVQVEQCERVAGGAFSATSTVRRLAERWAGRTELLPIDPRAPKKVASGDCSFTSSIASAVPPRLMS
jgi:hypothetical protein